MIRWVASSRVRLASAALALLAALVIGGSAGAAWVWDESASHTLNLIFLLSCAFVLLGFGAASATLLGDFIFPNRWRERVILGRRVPPPDDAELDSPDTIRGMKTFMAHFSALLVVMMALGGFGFDRVTDGFFTKYQRFGSLRTTLRSDDTEAKVESLKALASERRENRIRAVIDIVDMTWRDPRQPDAARTEAIRTLGSFVLYLTDAIDSWLAEGREDSWQGELFADLRIRLGPELRSMRANADALRRTELTYLSGLLRDTESQGEFVNQLATARANDPALWRATVVALGRMRTFDALDAIIPVAAGTLDDDGFAVVAWANQALAREFHRTRPDFDESRLNDREKTTLEAGVRVWSAHIADPSPGRRCMAASVILFMRDARMRDALIAAFDAPDAGSILCPAVPIDVGLGRREYMAEQGFLRRRIIDAMALISLGDSTVKEWVSKRLANAADLEPTVKALLTDFARHLGP